MSYRPNSGYGSHYDNASNPNATAEQPPRRQSGANTYSSQPPHRGTERPGPHGPSSYDWSSQQQQAYSGSHQLGSESWNQGQNSAFGYRREAGNFSVHSEGDNRIQHRYGNGLTTHDTQRLDNLAYASGLDNAATEREEVRPQHHAASTSNYSSAPNTTVHHSDKSPMQHAPQTHLRGLSNTTPTPSVSAAAALAGAVSRRFQQEARQNSQSPSVRPVSSASTAPQSLPRNTNATQSQAPPSRSQQQTADSNPARHGISNSSAIDPRLSMAPQQGHPTSQPSQALRPPPQQMNSISNLVTVPQDLDRSLPIQHQPMPHYIDPSQVFNPYHKEHERRRRESELAEAEARRKEAEAEAKRIETEAEQKQAELEAKREQAEAELKMKELEAAAESKQREAESKLPKESPKQSNRPPANSGKKARGKERSVSQAAQAPPTQKEDMANELRTMMEKMKQFRNQDPELFQHLWDDMRKGGSAAAAKPAHSASPKIPPTQSINSTLTAAQLPMCGQTTATNEPAPASSPFPIVPLNGYRVVVPDNDEGLPDLGRFPAERRIRSTYRTRDSLPIATPIQPPVTIGRPLSESASGDFPPSSNHAPVASPNKNHQPNKSSAGTVGPPPGPFLGNTHQYGNAVPAGVPQKPRPAKAQPGGMIWPEEKRNAVAEATVKSLKALPENAILPLTLADIHALLIRNPSYIELCEMLEKRGLRFHRGYLARQLLNSVPDLTAPPAFKPSAHPQPFSIPPPKPMDVPPRLPHMPVQVAPIQFQALQRPAVKFEAEASPKPVNRWPPVPSRLEPPPGSKEAMARKRNFSDLVDLTQLSDNEDYVMSHKHARLGSPEPDLDPLRKLQTTSQSASNLHPSQPQPRPPTPPTKTILAKPINKSEALRKSYYDPKTVARDILIASGRHLTERALNAHMAGLLGKHIELNSDLSTFDWDAIDPGGPPLSKVEYVDIPAGPPRFKLGQRRDVDKEREKERDREREPDGESERDLRLPDSVKRGPSVGTPATAPSEATRLTKQSLNSIIPTQPSKLRHSLPVDGSEPQRSVTPRRRRASNSLDRPHAETGSQPPNSPKMDVGQYSSGKRRGRPPGAKNKNVPVAGTEQAAQPRAGIPRSSTSSQPVFRCKWIRCQASLHNLGTLRRHIIRLHTPLEQSVQEHGFTCWWKGCSNLQVEEDGTVSNTEAFEDYYRWLGHIEGEHLEAVAMKYGDGPSTAYHGKPKDFDVSQYRYTPSVQTDARTFSYLDPQSTDLDKARFLSDKRGRSTTPMVSMKSNKSLPADALTLTRANGDQADLAAQKSFIKAHRTEKVTPKTNAEETLRAMEARSARIGPAIDRGGCTLVSEARRVTLIQNPRIARVVDGDY